MPSALAPYWHDFWDAYGRIGLRYAATALTAFVLFYGLLRGRAAARRIQRRFPARKDYLRELGYSAVSVALFAAMGVLIFHSPLTPYSRIYWDFAERSTAWYVFSFVLMVFTHDAYFYWIHRAMHHPALYRRVHLVHHRSTNPSPWAAYAFHPVEAFLEAAILPVMAFSFPIHASAFGLFFLFQIVYNVYGHLGYELYPKGFHRHWLGRWINTSTHHNLHHRYFRGSYGLYFTIWDRLMGTMAERYDATYAAIDARRREAAAVRRGETVPTTPAAAGVPSARGPRNADPS